MQNCQSPVSMSESQTIISARDASASEKRVCGSDFHILRDGDTFSFQGRENLGERLGKLTACSNPCSYILQSKGTVAQNCHII